MHTGKYLKSSATVQEQQENEPKRKIQSSPGNSRKAEKYRRGCKYIIRTNKNEFQDFIDYSLSYRISICINNNVVYSLE